MYYYIKGLTVQSRCNLSQVLSITDRAESEGEQFYKVNWKDGDSTWEPISNLGTIL